MKIFLILLTIGLSFLSCNKRPTNQEAKQSSDFIENDNSTKEVNELLQCLFCDSVYNALPKDSFEFEQLYGYPNGSRQNEAQQDFLLYFNCLDSCFNLKELIVVTLLGSRIKFDADGPTFLQYYLTAYLMKNKEMALELYKKTDCKSFTKHLNFLYIGVENSNFMKRLCNYLSSLDLRDECKEKLVKEYCKKDYKINDH
jgi:hypothetical protein